MVTCVFEAVPSDECPDNANDALGSMDECSTTMPLGDLCEADQTLPDGTHHEIDNCPGDYDVFKCTEGDTYDVFKCTDGNIEKFIRTNISHKKYAWHIFSSLLLKWSSFLFRIYRRGCMRW